MKTVAIVGVGLIGGSLGQGLRRSKKYRVLGLSRRSSTIRLARRLGAIDRGSTDYSVVSAADIVVIATPIDRALPTLKRLLPFLRAGTVITDVGSVKDPILKGVAKILGRAPVTFVGGHPLAGSHNTGVRSARPDLFVGSTCVLVPLGKAPVQVIASLWKTVGAKPQILPAERHDAAVAMTSHLPHLIAHALVKSLSAHPDRALLKKLVAGSFRDMTRVASADPDQWREILRSNAVSVRQGLVDFRRQLDILEKNLTTPKLLSLLKASHRFRRPLFHGI